MKQRNNLNVKLKINLLASRERGDQIMEGSALGRGSVLSRLGAELELRRCGSSLGPSQ